MAKKIVHLTPSGTELSDDEYRDIQKRTQRDTVTKILACVGIGALIVVAKGWIDSHQDNSTQD